MGHRWGSSPAGRAAPVLLTLALAALPSLGSPAPGFPAAGNLPSQPDLPDPLLRLDGRKVTSRREWERSRRPELRRLFQHYMYGYFPAGPRVHASLEREDPRALGGMATLREIRLSFGPKGTPPIHLLLLLPNNRRGPVPAFLGLSFRRNHAVVSDPNIPIRAGWSYPTAGNSPQNPEAERGSQADVWNAPLVLARGYALATFFNGDVDPDFPDFSNGVHPHFRKGEGPRGRHEWGAIAAWAWGLSRAMDYLVTVPEINRKKVAVVGHSRNGKAALLAAAFDDRFALAIPHQAGCGGTAPSRGKVGESVKAINDRFPHWFCDEFKSFNEQPERLPFDQNGLVALVAPRPVLLSNAEEDTWANPAGQFDVLKAAVPAYRLYAPNPLGVSEMPPSRRLIDSPLGYFIRPGRHSMNGEDWAAFLAFADRHLGPAPASRAGAGQGWRAGVAAQRLTPPDPFWLAGYGSRRQAAGTRHDVWVKSLALEDASGGRAVVAATDLMGVSKGTYDRLSAAVQARFGLDRSRFMLAYSHNHCAPVTSECLPDYYPLEREEWRRVEEVTAWIEAQILKSVGEALASLQPAELETGEGECGFAVNRRNNREDQVPGILARGERPKGPVDHSVPVLAVRRPSGRLAAVLFGYACHPTTLSDLQWCGDYPGYAQLALEREFPGATALFFTGCGGDQNPLPRRTVELCERYGRELASTVAGVLRRPGRPLFAELRTAFQFVRLDFDRTATDEELKRDSTSTNPVRARWARRTLALAGEGATFPEHCQYGVQAWRLGDQLWIALGGEAVVDYSLRFKQSYGSGTWVGGYAHDMVGYVPSRRVWREGGYEAEFIYEYGWRAYRWSEDTEDRIASAVERLVAAVRGDPLRSRR